MKSPSHVEKRIELTCFLLVAGVIGPLLVTVAIGSIGLSGWLLQVLNGPPS